MCVDIVIFVKLFPPRYSHRVIPGTEPGPMDPSPTVRLLDAVTVFGGELDSLGTKRGVSTGQGGKFANVVKTMP